MITVTCSNCNSKMRVPDNAAGKRGKCPKCGALVAIPAATSEEPTLPPQPPSSSPFDFDSSAAPPPSPAGPPAAADPFGEISESPAPPRAEEDDELPSRRRRSTPTREGPEAPGLSIASLVCGIVSVLCCGTCFPLSLAAIVLGILGRPKGGSTYAVAGIALGCLSILMACLLGILQVADVIQLPAQF